MYLDVSSTTKPKSAVISAMMPYLTEDYFNPSSLYSDAQRVKIVLDKAHETVAKSINAKPNEIYFTSGGSEANCWAIQGFISNRLNRNKIPYIITTKLEHKSILDCVKNQRGAVKKFIGVDYYGFVDPDELSNAIADFINMGAKPKDILVSIQFANNEVGSIQNIIALSDVAHMYGCVFHTDAVQAFTHTYIDVDMMGIDMLTASAHKIGGCKGTGFLYIRNNVKIDPLIYGSQMNGKRGGTENVAGIVGMATAVKLAKDDYKNSDAIAMKRDYFMYKLLQLGFKINGVLPDDDDENHKRLPNNINVMLPDGIGGEVLLYALDVDDIQIGTGSACNSRSVKPSHVLKAMGRTDDECAQSIRITIPNDMSMDDIDEVVKSIEQGIKMLKSVGAEG